MNKLIITGISGFVGQNLKKYFAKIDDVSITSISLRDPLKPQSIDGYDTVVHLAGKAHDLKGTSDPDAYYKVNFELTKELYDVFLSSNATKFIFISSVKAAADTVEGILTEDVIPNPQTHYGKSKLMAEDYIRSKELPIGKSYYILRPCMIHGPGNKGNLNLLYQFIKRGIPYPLAAFENKRSFLSIENLCFVIHKLVEGDHQSGIYQVADDDALSTNEVVEILSQSMNKDTKLLAFPVNFIKVLAKVGDFLKLPLNSERLKKLTDDYVVENTKIKSILDSSLPVSTKKGLIITAESFKI